MQQCHCGKPLHYTDPVIQGIVQRQVDALGDYLLVTVSGKTWLVPRHYIALHGIKGSEVHELGFEEYVE